MSLAIETDDVVGVLLGDRWHNVDDASFGIDSYEFMWLAGLGPEYPMLRGGQEELVAASGFSFREGAVVISGPLTSVLAVMTKPRS